MTDRSITKDDVIIVFYSRRGASAAPSSFKINLWLNQGAELFENNGVVLSYKELHLFHIAPYRRNVKLQPQLTLKFHPWA